MTSYDERPTQSVVRTLWHSTDGKHWREVDVLSRSPLSGGVGHAPDSWWQDGYGNMYRNTPPGTDE